MTASLIPIVALILTLLLVVWRWQWEVRKLQKQLAEARQWNPFGAMGPVAGALAGQMTAGLFAKRPQIETEPIPVHVTNLPPKMYTLSDLEGRLERQRK